VITTNRPAGYPGSGSYSLRVPVAINGATSYTASVGNIFCPNSSTTVGGYTISGYVYLAGPTLPLYAIVEALSWSVTDATNDYQTILLTNAGTLTIETNKWLPFSKTLVASPATNVVTLALHPNGAWSGTMYLDDVKITGF
jgi:hypothetical protein